MEGAQSSLVQSSLELESCDLCFGKGLWLIPHSSLSLSLSGVVSLLTVFLSVPVSLSVSVILSLSVSVSVSVSPLCLSLSLLSVSVCVSLLFLSVSVSHLSDVVIGVSSPLTLSPLPSV